ncbi:ubiquitin ISG15 [Lecanosticta acicola]|uniref:Ubiquitin ISG15 n=1 Tax=Lecanosticta acicola TaxID=111012 RepID=A0AAI9E832_9PEZI|nr:ubiquitin ISG15 [Lecanosticta acicola]
MTTVKLTISVPLETVQAIKAAATKESVLANTDISAASTAAVFAAVEASENLAYYPMSTATPMTFVIAIRSSKGGSYPLWIAPTTTVRQLKAMIAQRSGLAPELQQLAYYDKQLGESADDEHGEDTKLYKHGLRSGDVVRLVVKDRES